MVFFIMTPFVLEGFILGVIGGVVGVITLYASHYLALFLVPETAAAIPVHTYATWLLIFCSLLSCFASARSVSVFLKESAHA